MWQVTWRKKINRKTQNDKGDGITRQEVYKSSSKYVQEFKGNINVTRRNRNYKKGASGSSRVKSAVYELKKSSDQLKVYFLKVY